MAEHLGISKRTVHRYAAENKIPSHDAAGFERGTGFRRGRRFDLDEVKAALKVAA